MQILYSKPPIAYHIFYILGQVANCSMRVLIHPRLRWPKWKSKGVLIKTSKTSLITVLIASNLIWIEF